jgi:hypothetical protein
MSAEKSAVIESLLDGSRIYAPHPLADCPQGAVVILGLERAEIGDDFGAYGKWVPGEVLV